MNESNIAQHGAVAGLPSAGPPFAITPEWVLAHPDLSGNEKNLYTVYALNANRGTDLSYETLERMTGASRGSIRRWRLKLAEVGALKLDYVRDSANPKNVLHVNVTVCLFPPTTNTNENR
jgi:hypothetical protein